MSTPRVDPPEPGHYIVVRCISCRWLFASTDRVNNRVCAPCSTGKNDGVIRGRPRTTPALGRSSD